MAFFFPRNIGPIFVDVVVSEEATASMEIPSHPVERGAKISDHAWRLPTTLKMECVTQDVTGPWQALNDLMAEAEPFDILTGFDLFENMMIESIEPKRDAVWCNVLSFSVSLKEVILVSSEQTASSSAPGSDQRAAGKNNRGQVQPKKVETASGRGATVKATLPPPTSSGVGPY